MIVVSRVCVRILTRIIFGLSVSRYRTETIFQYSRACFNFSANNKKRYDAGGICLLPGSTGYRSRPGSPGFLFESILESLFLSLAVRRSPWNFSTALSVSISDEIIDDVIMTEIASDLPSTVSFVPEHSSSSTSNPRDEQRQKSEKKRSGEPLPADISVSKKISAKSSGNSVSVSPSDSPAKPSPPNHPRKDYALTFRYCSKDKPLYLV